MYAVAFDLVVGETEKHHPRPNTVQLRKKA